MKTKNSGVALIATAVIAVLLFISSGCTQNTAVNAENEKFDGNISNRNLAIFHDGEYFFNLTDGIWKCSETFENIDRLTYGYCEYPFIKNKTLYWISPDEGVCSLDLCTKEKSVVIPDDNVIYLAPIADGFAAVCEDKLFICADNSVNEYEFECGRVLFADDNGILYCTKESQNEMCMFDFYTLESSSLFSLKDGKFSDKAVSDGRNIYFMKDREYPESDLCVYDTKNRKVRVLAENIVSRDFNVSGKYCYYSDWGNPEVCSLFLLDTGTMQKNKLLTTVHQIKDINIAGDKLFYRCSDYGKLIEMYDISENSTLYVNEKLEKIVKSETSPDGRYDAYIYERFSETSPKILYKLTVLRRGEELQLENDDICESYDLYGFEWIDGNTLSVDGGENTDITLLNTEISDINVLMPEKVGKVS